MYLYKRVSALDASGLLLFGEVIQRIREKILQNRPMIHKNKTIRNHCLQCLCANGKFQHQTFVQIGYAISPPPQKVIRAAEALQLANHRYHRLCVRPHGPIPYRARVCLWIRTFAK